jgi:hypothetical protein
MNDARIYDVWIEGPTGGMAVKGLVRTARTPNGKTSLPRVPDAPPGKAAVKERPQRSRSERSNGTALNSGRAFRKVDVTIVSDSKS